MLMFHCSLLRRIRSTECFPDLLGMVHKRGEMAFIGIERRSAMWQGLYQKTGRSRWHHPILLSLPEKQVLTRDRFEGYVPGFAVDQPIFCRSVCCLSKTLSRSLGKCLSDRLLL